MAAHEVQVPGTRSPPHDPSAAPVLHRGKRCRCGGGRMVVWGRKENLPRSGLSRGSDGILALIVRHFHVAGLYTPIYEVSYNTYACSMSDVPVSEAAIGHPDMWSAYSRHAHGQATHAENVPIFRTCGTLSNIRNLTGMQLKF